MVAWDKAKGKQNTGSSNRKEIERLTLPIGDTKIRLRSNKIQYQLRKQWGRTLTSCDVWNQ